MLKMASFIDLSDDILYLILSFVREPTEPFHSHGVANSGQLGSERPLALHCLRLVCRRLQVFAESVLYRNIVLQEDEDAQEQASYRFIERILDPTDTLRRHVRSLGVKSFKGDDDSSCMNTQMLLACVRSIDRLDSFRFVDSNALPRPRICLAPTSAGTRHN